MRYIGLLVATICLCVLLTSCGKKAEAVLIVKEEGVSTKGRVEVTFNQRGGYSPNPWVPGNIVIFRVDKTVAGEPGKAGMVYLINTDRRLENIGKVDLNKTDDELFAEYLKSSK